jgi:hypothetical protein
MPTHKKKSTTPANTHTLPEDPQQQFLQLLEQFFENFHLKEVDEHLWNWLVAAITRENCIYSNAMERANLVFFYENLEELFKKCWQLHNNQLPKSAH